MNVKLHEYMEIGEPYSNFTISVDGSEMQLRRFLMALKNILKYLIKKLMIGILI